MDKIVALGLIAAISTTCSYVPQLIRTWKLKDTNDISLIMYVFLCGGLIMWISYGTITKNLPVILSSFISFMFTSTLLILKIRDVHKLKNRPKGF